MVARRNHLNRFLSQAAALLVDLGALLARPLEAVLDSPDLAEAVRPCYSVCRLYSEALYYLCDWQCCRSGLRIVGECRRQ